MALLDETGAALLDETGAALLEEAAVPGWTPGDPWPGTTGGATRDGWSPYIRLFLTAAIGAGQPWTVGPDPADRLNGGNVVSFPGQTVDSVLDIDLTSRLTSLRIQAGATTADGIFSKPDAAVLEAEIYDPTTELDPLNPYSVYGLNSSQRLTAGTPVHCWVEIVDPATATITTFDQFTGTADRWTENWVQHPNDRRAILTATDPTKLFVKALHPALPVPVGYGEHVSSRINRIVAEYGWTGDVIGPAVWGAGHILGGLTPTDMGSSGWQQLIDIIQLEIGYLHFTRAGALRWLDRGCWTKSAFARIVLGDPTVNPLAHDIVIEATPLATDQHLHNSIYAGRDGGTGTYHIQSDGSVSEWGEQSFTKTDLQLLNDGDVTRWAQTALTLEGFPQTTLERIVVQPVISPEPWTAYIGILGIGLVTGIIRTVWQPPLTPQHINIDSRVVGWSMDVTPWDWTVQLELVSANISTNAPVFRVGPGIRDTLDSGYIVGF